MADISRILRVAVAAGGGALAMALFGGPHAAVPLPMLPAPPHASAPLLALPDDASPPPAIVQFGAQTCAVVHAVVAADPDAAAVAAHCNEKREASAAASRLSDSEIELLIS